jgi:tRNA(Arg) A34 adenosine deaminase TadA
MDLVDHLVVNLFWIFLNRLIFFSLAVICKDGQVIAKGANRVVPTNDPTAHAEMVTIRLACEALKTHNLEGCAIYSSCEPCPMCLGAIYWAHLDHIYFSHSKSDAKEGRRSFFKKSKMCLLEYSSGV